MKLSVMKIALLCFMLFALSGCSTSMGYRFLDNLIAWQVDDYVKWNNEQEKEFNQRLDDLMLWHQSTQLPLYSSYLAQLQRDMSQPLSEELLTQRYQQANQFSQSILQALYPDSLDMMRELSDQQVNTIVEKLREEIQQQQTEYSREKGADYLEQRQTRMEKFVARWIGDLTSEQEELVAKWNTQVVNTQEYWLQGRARWIEQFEQALLKRSTQDFKQQLHQLFFNVDQLRPTEYHAAFKANMDNALTFIVALQPSLTDKQQKHLYRELDQWINQFDRLASQVQPPSLAIR